ncbi:MAG: methyltransferase domain-containing protein [Gammaproteobacteria bacterium]|nr:methyltransferase domain-containing protein [Gammaproteobacteria bacterium]
MSRQLSAVVLAAFSVAVLAQAPGADINAPYKDPGLVVETWVERLEGEGRGAFDFRHQIVAALDVQPGQSVADVGAGTGLFEPLLAARVGTQGHVYAVDIVPKFIDYIRQQAGERGLSQVTAVLGTEVSAELAPASVDMVFVCDAYHHFEDYDAMLQSIRQALRPGGRLVVFDFDRVEGKSDTFILEHIRASKAQFTREIEANGFTFDKDITPEGMPDNFMYSFLRP